MPSAPTAPPPTKRYCSMRCVVMRRSLRDERDEVEAEWRIITPIEDAWAQLPPSKFPNYAAGGDGPESADQMIKYDRQRWRPLKRDNGLNL